MGAEHDNRRVAVIGALGRIGAAAGTFLTDADYQVIGLARNCQRHDARQVPFEVRPLRLDRPKLLATDLEGADVVAYCAGAHHGAVRVIHELEVFEINVLGAVMAALAAAGSGASRFIYLSSTAATAMRDQAHTAGAYVRSKWLAETLLAAMAFPRAMTVLRLGWVIDPSDEVAYRQLWPPSGRQVIVGDLPVPIVGLQDVSRVMELLARREHLADPALIGSLDLVSGCPSQSELYAHAESIGPGTLKVIDAKTIDRVIRLSRHDGAAEPPTWLTQSAPVSPMDWGSYGVSLGSWQSHISALWSAHSCRSQEREGRLCSASPSW